MEKGNWEILTIRSGCVEEKSKHFLADEPGCSGRRGRNPEKKQKLNDENTARHAARLLNINYRAGDILLGCDFDGQAMDRLRERADRLRAELPEMRSEDLLWLAAKREAELYLDRVRRRCKRDGTPLRYMIWVSDMDGKTGEMVRVHLHLVINREALPACREKWGRGRVIGKPLRQEDDYTALAEYLCNQVRRIPGQKKFVTSRNLDKPVVRRRMAASDAELRVPKGCRLLYRGAHEPGWTSQYIRYFRPRRAGPEGGGENSCEV